MRWSGDRRPSTISVPNPPNGILRLPWLTMNLPLLPRIPLTMIPMIPIKQSLLFHHKWHRCGTKHFSVFIITVHWQHVVLVHCWWTGGCWCPTSGPLTARYHMFSVYTWMNVAPDCQSYGQIFLSDQSQTSAWWFHQDGHRSLTQLRLSSWTCVNDYRY